MYSIDLVAAFFAGCVAVDMDDGFDFCARRPRGQVVSIEVAVDEVVADDDDFDLCARGPRRQVASIEVGVQEAAADDDDFQPR